MQVFASLTYEYVIKDLIAIMTTENANVINHVILENILIIKTISVE